MRPIGELDLATVPLVDAKLAELWSVGFRKLVVDLRGVRFLDSTGIRLLFSWHVRSASDGVAFSVIRGPRAVQRALKIADAEDRITYAPGDAPL